MSDSAAEWVHTTVDEAHKLEHRAVVAGYEGYDGSPLWVIRAYYEGELLPGKLAAKHNAAYVPWGGNENAVREIEVCCIRRPHKIIWQDGNKNDGAIPPNAIIGGRTFSGETLYVGRGGLKAPKTPGKIQLSHKVLYIPFEGKEVALEHYEIMCAERSPIEWIPTTPEEAYKLADRAVVAGAEAYDASPLWVIRANFQGDLVPGKLASKFKTAYIPWKGEENAVKDIEVCCARSQNIDWHEARNGEVPPNASLAGYTVDGDELYVGRAHYNGSLTPGKVHPKNKLMYISYEHKEVAIQEYEVLCAV